MASIGGSNIVRDGLVLCLDAANQKSYVSGSTVWRDISSNNYTGSLVNSPTFSGNNVGVLSFDGINEYVSIPFSTIMSSHTVISWVYINSLNKDWIPIIEFQLNGSNRAHYYVQGDLNSFIGSRRGFGANWSPNQVTAYDNWGDTNLVTVQSNTWYMLTGRLDGTLGDTFINTQKSKATRTGVSYSNVSVSDLYNARTGQSFYNSGLVANILVYNRALSDIEILQNYEALKSRYIY